MGGVGACMLHGCVWVHAWVNPNPNLFFCAWVNACTNVCGTTCACNRVWMDVGGAGRHLVRGCMHLWMMDVGGACRRQVRWCMDVCGCTHVWMWVGHAGGRCVGACVYGCVDVCGGMQE